MLNKIEGGYLQLLRVVILIAATIALGCVIVLGLNASEGLFVKPIAVSEEIKITPKSFKTGKAAEKPKTPVSMQSSDQVKSLSEALGAVVTKHLRRLVSPTATINGDAVREVVSGFLNDKNLGVAYVEGLTKYVDESFKLDESAAGSKSSDAFFDELDKAFRSYETEYKAERARIEAEKRAALDEAEAKRSGALQSLYWSASCFAAFGMLVLLIVLIRVERNIHRMAITKDAPQTN